VSYLLEKYKSCECVLLMWKIRFNILFRSLLA